MFKDTNRKLPPVRFGAEQPDRLEAMVRDVKLALQSSAGLAPGAARGADPYNSQLGNSADDGWRRNLRRR